MTLAVFLTTQTGRDSLFLNSTEGGASRSSAPLSLFLYIAFPRTSGLKDSTEYNKLVSRRTKEGQAIIEKARGHLGRSSVEVEEELLEGPAAKAILSVAAVRKPDLIVMGSRGMGSLKGAVFGSVSTKVFHEAPCTVMVAR